MSSFEQRIAAVRQAREIRAQKSPEEKRAEYLARIPELRRVTLPDYRELIERYGGEAHAESNFRVQVRELFSTLETNCSYSDNDPELKVLADIYAVYLAQRQMPFHVPEWMKTARSYEAFIDSVVPHSSPRARGAWMNYMLTFVYHSIIPQRVFRVRHDGPDTRRPHREVIGAEGVWNVLLSSDPSDWEWAGSFEFVEDRLLTEARAMVNQGYRSCDLSHMTSTAALPGISSMRGLVASDILHKKRRSPNTGEYQTKASADFGPRRLSSVYASTGDPTWGYQTLRWFDERPVGFGINREAQRETIRKMKWKFFDGTYHQKEYDWGSEGVLLGSHVPLANVERVYCLQEDMEQLRKWQQDFCSSAELVAWDVADFIGMHDRRMGEKSNENGTTPAEEWEKMLSQARPVNIRTGK